MTRGSWNPERDTKIYQDRVSGMTLNSLSSKYKVSRSRAAQIVNRFDRYINNLNKTKLSRKETRDMYVANFGTWAEKVSLLLPNIEAIKELTKENKNDGYSR